MSDNTPRVNECEEEPQKKSVPTWCLQAADGGRNPIRFHGRKNAYAGDRIPRSLSGHSRGVGMD